MNRRHRIYAAAVGLMMILSLSAFAEQKEQLSIRIDQIDSSDYPEMTAYAVVRNQKGEPVPGLAPGLFSFRIDTADIKAKAKITPFTMAEEKVDYTILLSNNGIMEGEPLDFQKNAVLKFVELMNDNDTLSVYTIGEEAGAVCENVSRKQFDSSVINKIEISDAQPRLYDSIINLVRKVEQKGLRRKVMIILSDGRDQNSRFTKNQLADTLCQAGIPVYTVGMRILSNQTLSTLDEISQLTGGSYYYSPRISSLPDSMKHVSECVKQCYVIRLKVKGVKADNQAHMLEVRVDERDSEGKGLKTFTAVRRPVPKWLMLVLLVLAVLAVAAVIVLIVIARIARRKAMGITRRKCPDCGAVMKDLWESCPFCRYMPELKKKKGKNGQKK